MDKAIAEYVAALVLWPGLGDVQANLGVLMAEKGDHDESLRPYLGAIRRAPDIPEGYNKLGIELAACGQQREAIESFRRALASVLPLNLLLLCR